MSENTQCLTCGKPIFIPAGLRDRKKYCSRSCLAESKKRQVVLICGCCGESFTTHASKSDKKYCSPACRSKTRTSLTPDGQRQCLTCNKFLPATLEFFPPARTKLGLKSECRECTKARNKEVKQRRKEVDKALLAKYRKANTELVKQWKRESYLRNRERVIEKSRSYRLANPDRVKLAPEQRRAKDACRRSRKLNAPGKYTAGDIAQQYGAQAGRCFYCACELVKYHADHYIPLSRGGTNWPNNIVLACPACNMAKGDMMPDEFINGYLPISLKLRKQPLDERSQA